MILTSEADRSISDFEYAHNSFVDFMNNDLPPWSAACNPEKTFRLIKIENCAFVFGQFPMDFFSALMNEIPADSVLNTHLARLAGCTLAAGAPGEIQILIKKLEPYAIQQTKKSLDSQVYTAEQIQWLAIGQRGNSSNAIFERISGRPAPGSTGSTSYPHDVSDFIRCRLLLEAVPEFQSKIQLVSDVSLPWSKLVGAWEDICGVMDAEAPDWRNHKGGPYQKTDRLLRKLIGE